MNPQPLSAFRTVIRKTPLFCLITALTVISGVMRLQAEEPASAKAPISDGKKSPGVELAAKTPYFAESASAAGNRPRVLIFTKMAGYVHEMTPDSARNVAALCERNGISADLTNQSEIFKDEVLKRYRTLIFLNTSGSLFTDSQKAAFVRYIHGGGGFVGLHGAITAEPQWSWFESLIGTRFVGHPWVQKGDLTVTQPADSTVADLPRSWNRSDEWYYFQHPPKDVRSLITVGETRWHGDGIQEHGTSAGTIPPAGAPGSIIPPHLISWCHEFEGGRAFYTAMGHFSEAYLEPEVQTHLIAGIRWAASLPAPEPYRVLIFTKCTPQPYIDKAIPAVSAGLQALGTANGYHADMDSDGSKFTPAGLGAYKVVVMLNSCGPKLLDESQRAALKSYVQAGGGVVGIHAVAYTAKDWPWLGGLLGGTLDTDKHFEPQTVHVVDATHPASAFLPATFTHQDQWFRFKEFPKNVQVLMTVDGTKLTDLGVTETSYPVAWSHEYDGGRAFFTTFGHESQLTKATFANQILGAIFWAKGK